MAIKERWKGFAELGPDIGQALERLLPLFARADVLLAYLFGSLAQGRDANAASLSRYTFDAPPATRISEREDCAMVLKPEAIIERLKELDRVELGHFPTFRSRDRGLDGCAGAMNVG